MKSWQEIGFEVESTGDGSPSLRLLESVDPEKFRGESMHHSGGAWAETLLIYGNCATQVFTQISTEPHFLVVGLGLGYIELAIARAALLQNKEIGLITSFESVPELRTYFWNWLHDRPDMLSPEVWQTYENVAKFVVSGTDIEISEIKKKLRPSFPTTAHIYSELNSDFSLPSQYHGILYDAFSSKTTPLLWEEEFLTQFLSLGAAVKSIFSTYACRMHLRNALRRSGFEVVAREGFQGKRNSTLGLKGFEKTS